MANPATTIPHGAIPDLLVNQSRWIDFFARFTRDYRGAHARLEVLGPGVGYQVETEDRPFDGLATDVKDGEDAVWITFGSTPDDHLTHGVQGVTAIRVRPSEARTGPAVLIEARDGTKTLLELSQPEDYALPPAEKAEQRPGNRR